MWRENEQAEKREVFWASMRRESKPGRIAAGCWALQLLEEFAARAGDIHSTRYAAFRSLVRFTMRVGLPHLGQSVDLSCPSPSYGQQFCDLCHVDCPWVRAACRSGRISKMIAEFPSTSILHETPRSAHGRELRLIRQESAVENQRNAAAPVVQRTYWPR